VPSFAGSTNAARPGDVTGTLRLMAYLALSLTLVVLDHRGGWLHQARRQASLLAQPLWMIAGTPGRIVGRLAEDAGTLSRLTAENRELRRQALLDRARMARMQTVAADNARLRMLLDAAQRDRLDAQLAPILDVDLDPTRQRLVLDAGRGDGVREGQTVIDAGGLVGQVVQVTPAHATVLLLTDPDHAVPVSIARNGVRLVAYGRGRSDLLALQSIPLSSDIKVGDALVTSGLGGRFPPGFAVGTVVALRPDHTRAFLVGDVKPAAELDRGRDVLLLRSAPERTDAAPPATGSAANGAASSPSPAGVGGDAREPVARGPVNAGAPSAQRGQRSGAAPAGTGQIESRNPQPRPVPPQPSLPDSEARR
jgi:rod shape-determining protein MreC